MPLSKLADPILSRHSPTHCAEPKSDSRCNLKFPIRQDFTEKRLAGKTVAYDVEVKGIRKKILPELDDAFAKQMGEYETIDQFKEKLREHMANDKRRRLESEAKDKLVGSFVERYQFPVPESLLQQQIDARLDRGLRALAAQGMTTEQMRNLDFTRLRTAQRESAMNELRGSLILDRIAQLRTLKLLMKRWNRNCNCWRIRHGNRLKHCGSV